MTLRKVITLVILFFAGTWAQAICNPGFDWNKNSLEQDPCEIGSMLDASCRNIWTYNYPILDSDQYYVAPQANHTGDLACDCNTVMYSIYMACASCQGAQIYPWSSWALQCEAVDISQYPVPIAQGTAIPYWAFYNVTSLPSEKFDQNVAMSVGQNPEAFPTAPSTTVQPSPAGTGDSAETGSNPSSSNSNTAGAVGGSVGTVIVVILIVGWCCRRRRRVVVVQTTQQVAVTLP